MGQTLAELGPSLPRVDFEVTVDPPAIAEFHERGFLRVERITSDEELVWLGRVYDRLFADRAQAVPGGYFDLSRPYESAGPDRLPQILLPEALVPELRQTAFWRNGRAIAARLLEAPAASLLGWGHMIRKPPRVGSPLPWHQDEAYWDPAFDYRALGCWMALDAATPENGCLRFIPGSHRGEVRAHRHLADDPSVHALVTDDVDADRAVAVPVPAGGAIFHHCRMLHSSGPNTTAHVRRGYANEWQLAPVRRASPEPRPWVEEGKRAWEARRIR